MMIQEFGRQRCSPAFYQISRRSGSSLGLVHIRLAWGPDKLGKHLQLRYLEVYKAVVQYIVSLLFSLGISINVQIALQK